jgi:hypothetical protein
MTEADNLRLLDHVVDDNRADHKPFVSRFKLSFHDPVRCRTTTGSPPSFQITDSFQIASEHVKRLRLPTTLQLIKLA